MIEVVCAIISKSDGTILVCQRPLEKCEGGKWEFAGGKVEPNETSEEALRREILEELGITITVGTPLTPIRHGEILLRPFLVEIIEGELTLHEHLEARWVSLTEADQLDWAAADLPILKELR